jgi:hypothetical protein
MKSLLSQTVDYNVGAGQLSSPQRTGLDQILFHPADCDAMACSKLNHPQDQVLSAHPFHFMFARTPTKQPSTEHIIAALSK